MTQPKPVSQIVVFKQNIDRLNDAGELPLPSTVSFTNFKNAAVVAMTDNKDLARCSQESLFKAIRTLASAGLVPDGREAAIVPYKGTAQAMPMVAGLVKIARNSGKVSSLWADVVYDNERLDTWVEDGERKWDHVQDDGEKLNAMTRGGKITGAYAVAKLTDGTVEFRPMTRVEIEKRRRSSANQKSDKPTGIWEKWYDQMALKTVIRNLCKFLPMSSEDVERMMMEQEPLLRDVTPTPEQPGNFTQKIQAARQSKDPTENAEDAPATKEDRTDDAIEGEIVTDDFNPDPFSDEYAAGSNAFKAGDEPDTCHLKGDARKNWMAGFNFEANKGSKS